MPTLGARSLKPGSPLLREGSKLVIVGNGMVGARFLSELVERGMHRHYRIFIIGEEPHLAYDRIHLSDYAETGDLDALYLHPETWYHENRICLVTGTAVTSISRESKLLELSSGDVLPYDSLVLATGSRATLPNFPLALENAISPYRTIEDVEALNMCH